MAAFGLSLARLGQPLHRIRGLIQRGVSFGSLLFFGSFLAVFGRAAGEMDGAALVWEAMINSLREF